MAHLTLQRFGSASRVTALATVLTAGLACAGAAGAADVYRWVDENGVVNYSQTAPDNARGTVERVRTASGRGTRSLAPAPSPARAGAPATPANDLTAEQQALKEQLEADEREQLARIARERADACRKNRDLLNELTTYARIRVTDADGTMRILPEEERRARIKDVQARVVEYCTST